MAKKIIIFIFLLPLLSPAQQDIGRTPFTVCATVYNGDTIPYITLDPVVCYTSRFFKNPKDAVKWDRIKYNVKKVYPYAILAAAKLKEYKLILAQIPDENDRKKYMKLAEKQLKVQFGEELKNLSMTQGRILIKLVYRETGITTYDLVKEMRGPFSAFMWQSLAFVFSSNLKDDYDAKVDDKAIEEAIKLIESGDF